MPKINLFKKLSLIFLSSVLFLNSMAMPFAVAAQDALNNANSASSGSGDSAPSTWYNQGFTDWYAKVYGDESPPSEIFGERYTAAQVQWILYSLFSFPINFLGSNVQGIVACTLAAGSDGINIIADAACIRKIIEFITPLLESGPWSELTATVPVQSNLTFVESITTDYHHRPLSGIKYVSNSISSFLSVPTANAQGFGFGAVDGLQKYWQGFRDMSYALTVLVVIVFAFMIMFRVKLSPQLVISVQSALPKVFVALILATFSYAIAGFVIDLSYVVGGLFASLMELADFASFTTAWNFIVPSAVTTFTGGFYIFFYMFAYTFFFFIAAIVSFAGTLSGLSGYGYLASMAMLLMSIWVLILMFWYTLKVPWVLLKNLISLFLSIVVAPVQIVLGAIVPTIGFNVWLRKIIAESLVFPLTGLFMFLAWKTLFASMAASLGQVTQIFGAQQQNLWAPPILGSSEDMAGILWLAVSFVFITMIPKAVDIMKMLVMGAKFEFGSAMGEAMGAFGILPTAQKAVQGTFSDIGQTYMTQRFGSIGGNKREVLDRLDSVTTGQHQPSGAPKQ